MDYALNFNFLKERDIHLGKLSDFEKDELQAEVLIRKKVEVEYIRGIYLITEKHVRSIPANYRDLAKIDETMFFNISQTNDFVVGFEGSRVGKKRCPRCGELYYDDQDECTICGWIFYKKECPRCGELIEDNATYCSNCYWEF